MKACFTLHQGQPVDQKPERLATPDRSASKTKFKVKNYQKHGRAKMAQEGFLLLEAYAAKGETTVAKRHDF